MIKLKSLLNEVLFGRKFLTNIEGALSPTLLSKNTCHDIKRELVPFQGFVGGEKEYRITWFTPEMGVVGHVDIDKEEADYMILHSDFPPRIKEKFETRNVFLVKNKKS